MQRILGNVLRKSNDIEFACISHVTHNQREMFVAILVIILYVCALLCKYISHPQSAISVHSACGDMCSMRVTPKRVREISELFLS